MATSTKKTRILMKTDTTANWALATTFVPLPGEICVYSDGIDTGTVDENGNKIYSSGIKVGDGRTNVNDLLFTNAVAIPSDEISRICGTSIIHEEEAEF